MQEEEEEEEEEEPQVEMVHASHRHCFPSGEEFHGPRMGFHEAKYLGWLTA